MTHLGEQLSECEKEPLAHSGRIQNDGALLHIDRASGRIDFVSENTAAFIGDDPADLLGADGRAWVRDFLPDMGELPSGAGRRFLLERALDLGFGELDALISATASGWLIELETSLEPLVDPGTLSLLPTVNRIDAAVLASVQQDLIDRIAEITGFDRVMLYEFKSDWSGEVLAERVARSKGTYLGLRFPASDIPAIARALYAQTPYRHIPDVASEPVGVMSATSSGEALDLTWSDLRSVSPVHRQYLHNMHVAASFSISVILDGKLWGLVACHNPEPLRVPAATRIACQELVSHYVSVLSAYRHQVRSTQIERLENALRSVQERSTAVTAVGDLFSDCLGDMVHVFDADTIAIVIDDQVLQLRTDDDPELIRRMHHWSLANQSGSIVSYDHLPDPIADFSTQSSGAICGLMSVTVRAKQHGNKLLGLYFFRPEESLEIAWAGNPEKPVETTEGSERLSPRNSFDKWVEVRTGYSRPWDELTLFTAQQLQRRLEAIL